MLGAAPSNTHRLQWFHSIHAPKIIKEFSPFLVRADVAMCTFSHHSSKHKSLGSGAREWRPTCLRMRYQNCLVKTAGPTLFQLIQPSWVSAFGLHPIPLRLTSRSTLRVPSTPPWTLTLLCLLSLPQEPPAPWLPPGPIGGALSPRRR
jgi:hypothetical protein